MKKIYIVHGWAYETQKWQPFLDLLKKDGFEPVLLNVPGLTKPLSEAWTIANYADWLGKQLKENKAILLGHSFGGRICLEFSRLYPEKVTRLILVDSAGVYHNEFPIRFKRAFFKFLAKTGHKFTHSDSMRDFLYKLAREKDYNRAKPHMKQTMTNMILSDKDRDISTIKTPTTIFWGESDVITPLSDSNYFHENLKNSTLHIITSARHSPQFTHSNEVVQIIRNEINRDPETSSG